MSRVIIGLYNDQVGGWLTYARSLQTILEKLGHQIIFLVDNYNRTELLDVNVISIRRTWLSRKQIVSQYRRELGGYQFRQFGINISSEYAGEIFDELNLSVRVATIHSICDHEIRRALRSYNPPTRIVCVSHNVLVAVQKYLGSTYSNLTTVIYPLVHVEKLPLIQTRKYHPSYKFKLIYVGRLTKEAKRVDLLPKICRGLDKKLVRYSMKIVGEGPYENQLATDLRSNQNSAVSLIGVVPHSDVLNEITKADCLVLPSDYEGTPHVILEALACGTVVIATKIEDSTTEIIDHQLNGILVPFPEGERVNGVVESIVALAKNPQAQSELSEAGGRKYQRDYSAESISGRWNDIIQTEYIQPCSDSTWLFRVKFRIRDQILMRMIWRAARKLFRR